MKLYTSLLSSLFIGISTISTITPVLNNNLIMFETQNKTQNLELEENDGFENLLTNIVKMAENNIFWSPWIKFDHWKNGSNDQIMDQLLGTIPEIYKQYFDNQMLSFKKYTSREVQVTTVRTYDIYYTNDTPSEQEWATPGYTYTVTNHFSYSLSINESDSISASLSVGFMGIGGEASYNKVIETGKTTETGGSKEETDTYPPLPVVIEPKSFAVGTYRIDQGTYAYTGALSTINPKAFELKLPTFITKDGREVNATLTAATLLEGLEKAGYNMAELGLTSTKYTIFSYDNTKDIKDVTAFSFNLPIEWTSQGATAYFTAKVTPLP